MLTGFALAGLFASLPVQPIQSGPSPEELNVSMQGDVGVPFRRTCAADLDGSGLIDLVAVRGGELEIVGDPALFGWASGYLGSVHDVAVLDGGDPDAPDTLVTVGPNGAQEWSHFEVADASTGASDPQVELLGSTGWLDAVLVTTGKVYGEERPRIVGCKADLRTLRTLRYDPSLGYINMALPLSPALTDDVVDLALVDFVGNNEPYLVVLTNNSLRLFNLSSGVQVAAYVGAAGWTNVCMTVGRTTPGGPEWIAAIVDHPDGIKQYLSTVDAGGKSPLQYLPGDPRVVAMDAGSYQDVEGGGSAQDTEDLVLSLDSTNKLWVLLNEPDVNGAAFEFGPTRKFEFTYPSTTTGNQDTEAFPAFEDADNDGDVDILFPVRATSALHVRLNTTIAADKAWPILMPAVPIENVSSPNVFSAPDLSLSLRVVFAQPPTPPEDATHLQLAVFYKADTQALTERVSRWSDRFPIDPEEEIFVLDLPGHDPSPPPDPPGGDPLPASYVARFENIFVVLFRYVKEDSGSVVRAYPGAFYGLETSVHGTNEAYLLGLAIDDPVSCMYGGCSTCSIEQTGDEIGTVMLLPSMPTPAAGPMVVQ